jgi:ferredoxin
MGADLVGITPMSRFEGAPLQMDPRTIMPNAKSMVVVGFRINRGALRGIEEGTHFMNYASMAYGAVNTVFMPNFIIRFSRIFEDEGYEAMPFGYESTFGNSVDSWVKPDPDGPNPPLRDNMLWSKPVAPGKPAPDVLVHVRIAAYLAGLGEIGYSKVFLTPQFGPRQRLFMVMTELELEPDPIYSGPPLCNRCMACVRECPGQAISPDKTVKVTLAGHEVEWGEFDPYKCLWAFRGAEALRMAKRDTTSPAATTSSRPRTRRSTKSRLTPSRTAKRSAADAAASAPAWSNGKAGHPRKQVQDALPHRKALAGRLVGLRSRDPRAR